MKRRLFATRAAAALAATASLLAASLPATARAQAWPSKPITLVVPFSAGGGVDVMSRLLAGSCARRWARSSTSTTRPAAAA